MEKNILDMEAKKETKPSKWTTLTIERQSAKEIKQIALDNDLRHAQAIKMILQVYKDNVKIKEANELFLNKKNRLKKAD